VLLDQVLDFLLLEVFELVVLEVQDDLCATAELLGGVTADEELTTSAGFPNVPRYGLIDAQTKENKRKQKKTKENERKTMRSHTVRHHCAC
jgi:hypothetical protein